MKCPIIGMAKTAEYGRKSPTEVDCIDEECAWWDKENEQCGLMTIAGGMWLFNLQMVDVIKKMPHEQQFRR